MLIGCDKHKNRLDDIALMIYELCFNNKNEPIVVVNSLAPYIYRLEQENERLKKQPKRCDMHARFIGVDL